MADEPITLLMEALRQGKAIRFREIRDMDDVWYGFDKPTGQYWHARVSFYTPGVFKVSFIETEADFRKFISTWPQLKDEAQFDQLIAQLEDDPRPN